ncbi:electron transport complex subunit RsxC [Paraferrimonas sedimenticola]|uniref:Ion-translocating oxidoreductase complex subunit C n=1 Tax=Paraferrimonas sedimenticola TaxID=375674 RepID=A0AA37VZX9_9GAMM|nr:electron transport complex subunit RsxC [Paraferrimonas sedimenticola]GLP97886.1 electron transport complex subunit C [Paraferrimonas sedimenticola]
MQTLLEQIDQGKLWNIPGGIHPPTNKAHTSARPIATMAPVPRYYVPVSQHIGDHGRLLVKVGDKVLKGQALTQASGPRALPVHAPTSGHVVSIEPLQASHPSGLSEITLCIEADGQDHWRARSPRLGFQGLENDTLLNIIQSAGIAGLGGAVFPSHTKLALSGTELLIINGVECEPYITADDRLMQECAQEITQGIAILERLLTPKRILIAIEDDKPAAVKAMEAALNQAEFESAEASVRVIPTKYPSGGEKQLIQILTGQEVPSGKLPSALGIVSHNVATAYAVKKAVYDDEPLIQRVVTVTGGALSEQQNMWVPIGTPIHAVLEQCGYQPQAKLGVVMGGPMMGFMLPSIASPVVKATNCLLAASSQEMTESPQARACIRCGECAVACPAKLQPQQLYWYAQANDAEKSQAYNLFDCIECGCCAYVCPSDIPLVEAYRIQKADIRAKQIQQQAAEEAKIRFEARIQRLEQEKQARANKHKKAAQKRQASMSADQKDLVAQAMARVKAKQSQPESEPQSDPGDAKKAAVAKALARAKAKKQVAESEQSTATETDPKKAAVARALAKAKAKKQAQASDSTPQADAKKAAIARAVAKAKAKRDNPDADVASPATKPNDAVATTGKAISQDPKKAAIARAVAKAKAKQQAAQAENAEVTTEAVEDPKKAAIARAVAKAKAKQQAAKVETQTANEPEAVPEDPKKAAIARAVAKAKAKQQAAKVETQTANEPEPMPEDPKKAAIARAVAKAKAKRAAQLAAKDNNKGDTDGV